MSKKKSQTLLEGFGEQRDLCLENLDTIIEIIDRADRAKECVLLSEQEADKIRELAAELEHELRS